MSKLRICLTCIIFVVSNCSNPYKIVIPEDFNDPAFVKAVNTLPEEDKKLLESYLNWELAKRKGGNDRFEIMTIEDAIKLMHKIRKQRIVDSIEYAKNDSIKSFKDSVKAANDSMLIAKINNEIVFKVDSITYNASESPNWMKMHCILTCRGKGISGIKGTIYIYDQFDVLIKSKEIQIEQELPSGSNVKGTRGIEYDKRLLDYTKRKMKARWAPSAISYLDGTVIKLPKSK